MELDIHIKYSNSQCKIVHTLYKTNIINHLYTLKNHLDCERRVYVDIFLRML